MRKLTPLLLVLVLLLVPAACAKKQVYITEYHKVYADWAPVLETASAVIKESSFTVGRLYGEGLITEKQLEQARAALKLAEVARRDGEATLAAYLEGRSTRAAVVAAITKVQLELVDILKLIDSVRVGTVGGKLL